MSVSLLALKLRVLKNPHLTNGFQVELTIQSAALRRNWQLFSRRQQQWLIEQWRAGNSPTTNPSTTPRAPHTGRVRTPSEEQVVGHSEELSTASKTKTSKEVIIPDFVVEEEWKWQWQHGRPKGKARGTLSQAKRKAASLQHLWENGKPWKEAFMRAGPAAAWYLATTAHPDLQTEVRKHEEATRGQQPPSSGCKPPPHAAKAFYARPALQNSSDNPVSCRECSAPGSTLCPRCAPISPSGAHPWQLSDQRAPKWAKASREASRPQGTGKTSPPEWTRGTST